MQIIENTINFLIDGKSAVAIGKFDGIHLGHQKLLHDILEQKEAGYKAVVFTFDPPPSVLFGKEVKDLMIREEKRAAFEKMGIDVLIEFPLNRQTAAIQPEEFIADILVGQIHAEYIAAGTDVSFGDRGAGNCELLSALALHLGYQLSIIDKVCYKGREVSSTYVREAVKQGNMQEAAILLGTPYSLSGTVIQGNRIGRTMGMPTINLSMPENKLAPPNGVYYSQTQIAGESYCSITNIGWKPTVSDSCLVGAETYIYHFDRTIYGTEVKVNILDFKRREIKFETKEALAAQMTADLAEGQVYHGLSGR